jgi:hypothetical protein
MGCAERAGKAKLLFSRAPETRHGRRCLGVDQYSRSHLIVGSLRPATVMFIARLSINA